MFLKSLFLIGLLGFSIPQGKNHSFSSGTFELRGSVVEEETGEPVTGAAITVEESGKEVYSDFDGNFSLEDFKPGIYHIRISLISFKPVMLDNIHLDKNSEPLFISLN